MVSVLSRTLEGAAGLMASMESSWLLFGIRPVVMPEATTDWMATSTVLVRSRSEIVSVPELDRPAFVSVREAELLLPVCTVIVGASLLPVRVIVTSWVRTSISLLPDAEV